MAPFYGWGSTVSRLQSHYEESLLFTTKSTGGHGTHLIDLGGRKTMPIFEASSGFERGTPGLGIQCSNHEAR